MASHFLLFGRPLVMDERAAGLQVVGSLPDYEAGDPFEGRLDIINSVGRCTVEVVEGNLPAGATVRVDNLLKQVVIKWPGYKPEENTSMAVPNGDFSQGDDGSWALGPSWSIKNSVGEGGGWGAEFGPNYWGNSSIEGMRVPYRGQSITASARFQQGASSSGNLNGRVLLIWCDAQGNMLPGGEGVGFAGGDLIKSGSNGAWKTSTVTAASATAKTVAVGFSCRRNKQNRPAWLDNFTWNHTYSLGVDNDYDDFFLRIKVTDGLNRVAYWYGVIWSKSIWRTSPIFPQFLYEDFLSQGAEFLGASSRDVGVNYDHMPEDFLLQSAQFLSASSKSPQNDYSHLPEDFLMQSATFLSARSKNVQITHTQPAEDFLSQAAAFQSAWSKAVLVTAPLIDEDFLMQSAQFMGASSA